MIWDKQLSEMEYIFIGIFLAIYVLYIARTLWIANKLGTTARSILLKFFLRSVYFGLIIMALLGPSFGKTEIEAQATGKDIYLAIDLSKSMDAVDIEPSRLEKVKFELLKNLIDLKSNRVGLIIFSSDAYIHSPLTFDQDALKLFIQRLNTGIIAEGGTNLNAVFELTNQKFLSNKTSNNRAKVIILITDGEDFGEIDSKMLKAVVQNKINVLILGVGTQQGGKIKLVNKTDVSGKFSFKKDKSGKEIETHLNPDFLKKLASNTNGVYFELNNQKNELSNLIKASNNFENQQIDSRKISVEDNKYFYFLILALLLIVVDVLVTVRTIKL